MPKDVPQDTWLHCPHREWHDATPCPTSSNIPVSAHGAVFPGDEGGYECALGGHPCDVRPSVTCCPRYAVAADQADDGRDVMYCPDCAEGGDTVELLRRQEGFVQDDYEDVYVCPRCDFVGPAAEALRVVAEIGPPEDVHPVRILAVPHHACTYVAPVAHDDHGEARS